MLHDQLDGLFQKKMDRLTFLKHVGIGIVALTGVSTLLKTMGGFGSSAQQTSGYGYGASVYGGKSEAR